jgi:SAM-dependent methyltransferase
MDRQSHWKKVWTKYNETEVSWFQNQPALSIDLVLRHVESVGSRILDVGGGSSRLVDSLLGRGFRNVGVMDVAAPALEIARARLGDRAESVEWIVADALDYAPTRRWDVWHDRAVFHFLLEPAERASYVQAMLRSLNAFGCVVIATFGPDGPDRCSGLDVKRHSPESLAEVFGPGFELVEDHVEMHRTPGNKDQQFVYCVFRGTE